MRQFCHWVVAVRKQKVIFAALLDRQRACHR